MNQLDSPPGVVRLRLPLARAWLSWVVLGLVGLAFAGQIAGQAILGQDWLLMLGSKVNAYIVRGEWWRLFTPMFLHVGLTHFAFNAYALYVLGPEVEAWYGTGRFATIYLLAGLAGNVLSFALNPAASAGASTALFGLIAAELVFFFKHRDKFGPLGQSRLTNLVAIVVINFVLGLSSGVVDNLGHLGGFVGGASAGWLLCPQYEVEALAGLPHVVDRNSLRRAWPGVALTALAILAIAYLAVLARTG